MKQNLKKIVHESLNRIFMEQMTSETTMMPQNAEQTEANKKRKKNDNVNVPESCFGGPKKQAGALVALVQVLMKDSDRNGERAVEEIKKFSEGKSKPDPKEVVLILQKYGKTKYLGYAGCF